MTLDLKLFIYRTFIMLCVAAFCFTHPRSQVLPVMIVLGQAHFTLAYLYQFKAGKMNRAYGIRFAVAFVLLFGSFALFQWKHTLGFVTAFYFVIHFLYDERHLLAERTDFFGWMRLFPILLLFGAWLADDWYELNYTVYAVLIALATSGFVMWLGEMLIRRRRPNYQDLSFILVFALTFLFIVGEPLLGIAIPPNALMFIILTHYMNWYFHYFVRFKSNPPAFRTLLKDTLLLNGLMVILFLAYRYIDNPLTAGVGHLAFDPSYFYLWTLMHYLVTFRPSDLENWVPQRLRKSRQAT